MKTAQNAVETAEVLTFFVRGPGGPAKAVKASPNDSVEMIIHKAGFTLTPDMFVFLGESEDAASVKDDVDGEDCHEPVHHGDKPGKHGHHGGHIHCHHCKRIAVTVTFNGRDKHHKFSPAATVQTVKLWAKRRFGISDTDASRLILKLSGVTDPPSDNLHLGELAKHGCELSFELVPDPRING